MKTATIEIKSVKEVQGFIHPNSIYAGNANRYNGSRHLTTRSYQPKALEIYAVMNGKLVRFYTPTVVVMHVEGFLNYDSMDANNWFEQIDNGMESARGAEMFDGHGMNVAIASKSTIQPKVKIGDVITISFAETNGKINRVRIAK